MSALDLYMPTYMSAFDPYRIVVAFLIVFGLFLLTRMMAECMQHSGALEKLESELSVLREQIKILEKKTLLAEKNIDFVCGAVSEQAEIAKCHTEMTKARAEDLDFACEIASTTYVQCHKPHITYMDEQVLKCLKKSPATAHQIHDYVTENKSLIHQNFFNNSVGELTRHMVNSCMYHLLNQGRVTKNNASPPVWSTK